MDLKSPSPMTTSIVILVRHDPNVLTATLVYRAQNINFFFFLGLFAKYYVNDRVKDQCEAVKRGLFEVVDASWLRIFNEPELQVLISGTSNGELDISDLKSNCRYTGGFTSIDPVSRFTIWASSARLSSVH